MYIVVVFFSFIELVMIQLRKVHCIAAIDSEWGIGLKGKLPWNLPKEYKFFQNITTKVISEGKQNAVIMGKNTWFSIPQQHRPLKNRLNVILSSSFVKEDYPENVLLESSLEAAISRLSDEFYANTIENIFVIGGPRVYKEAMEKFCDKIYLTKIEQDYSCDVFYPIFDKNKFKEIDDEEIDKNKQIENGVSYTFHVYSSNYTV
ncbi:dihydrofolate reductase [Hydra vulgaris]|uniref:dihydrofolate reductase n=1 Tax=Hydra vulgaris TaxID=6087 RepID=A0ABM4CKL3_HYDVU